MTQKGSRRSFFVDDILHRVTAPSLDNAVHPSETNECKRKRSTNSDDRPVTKKVRLTNYPGNDHSLEDESNDSHRAENNGTDDDENSSLSHQSKSKPTFKIDLALKL